MKNALIVVNYNDWETTNEFLSYIKDYKVLDKIFVVDNFSTNDSYNQLKKLENEKIEIVKASKNGGYGYGNNIGIKKAIKEFGDCNIIISNPDIIVKEDVLKGLLSDLNQKKEYALVGPIINTNGELNKGWHITSGFKEVLLSIPFFGNKLRDRIIGYSKNYYKKGINEVDVLSGCFFVAKAEAFKKIDFYDEKLFLYYEENVIATKLKKEGYKTIIDTDYEVIHNHSVSINKNYSSKEKYKTLKYSQIYYLNNYAKTSKVSILVIKFISRLIYWIKR